jgi:hypothetical protein
MCYGQYVFVVVGRKGERTGADMTVAGFVERETMVAELSTSWSDVIDAGRHKADAPDASTGSRALFALRSLCFFSNIQLAFEVWLWDRLMIHSTLYRSAYISSSRC